MTIEVLKSKIHRATITGADLNYQGSLTLDATLMKEAHIMPYEKVQIVNINNGARLETYVIQGPANSGVVQLNGAAARCGHSGDLVIILSYMAVDEMYLKNYKPTIVLVDDKNRPLAVMDQLVT